MRVQQSSLMRSGDMWLSTRVYWKSVWLVVKLWFPKQEDSMQAGSRPPSKVHSREHQEQKAGESKTAFRRKTMDAHATHQVENSARAQGALGPEAFNPSNASESTRRSCRGICVTV
mmetsp:Transcript_9713/g.17518  ORF Transcript_9713/g.17518 Transcript_9713/m.17518 type:complete len:116 (+) Transcript_9713:1953-2300(+)